MKNQELDFYTVYVQSLTKDKLPGDSITVFTESKHKGKNCAAIKSPVLNFLILVTSKDK